jgi:predicted dehydrogenase
MVEDSIVTWEFRDARPEDEKIRKQFSSKSAGGGVANPADINYQGHINNIKAFVESIENNRPFEIDGAEARKSVEIIRRIYGDAGLKQGQVNTTYI